MLDTFPIGLFLLIGCMAILYSSVGHGGASGYLAAMALFGLAPDVMKPTALVMNIGVSAFVLIRMSRLYPFDWKLFLLIAASSIPMAYLGGTLNLENNQYRLVVGLLLFIAAVQMIFRAQDVETVIGVKPLWGILTGALLGIISGLTGVGGGIYLSPIVLSFHWTNMRGSVMLAAAFILVNSLAGLFGKLAHSPDLPQGVFYMLCVALGGAVIGSELAARKLASAGLRRILGIVLIIAGGKFLLA